MSKSFMDLAVDKVECHYCKQQVIDIHKHLLSCEVKDQIYQKFLEDNKLPF